LANPTDIGVDLPIHAEHFDFHTNLGGIFMVKIYTEEPVIVQRHEGYLGLLESTHHYCTVGRTPDGTIIAFYGMHPDIGIPSSAWTPVDVPGSKYPIYKFRPRQTLPAYHWPHLAAYCLSGDGGRTWSEPVMTDGWRGAVPVGTKTLSAYGYLYLAEPGVAVASFRESDDNGQNWKDRAGVFFHFPSDLDLFISEDHISDARCVMNFENGGTLKSLSDGSLVTFATARMQRGDERWWLPLMFQSADGGYNFNFVSFPTGTEPPLSHTGFVEPALAELPNGDLLAVFRTGYHRPDRVMMQCRTSDGGKTWSEPVICPGIPRYYPLRFLHPIRNEGKTHYNAANVSPWLATLKNGVVALVYGRPGVYITFSEDGTGKEWRDRIPVVPEPSLMGCISGADGVNSSHMAGVIDIGESELLVFFDIYNYLPPKGGTVGNTVFALRMKVTR